MILGLGALAFAASPAAPITMMPGAGLRDAAGAPISWPEVRALARDTDAARRVRRRRVGRTVLRVLFAGVTAAEAWGASELARSESPLWAPLALQATMTGGAGVLLWTQMPQDRAEDRALLLQGVNARLRLDGAEATAATGSAPPPTR